jgi:hypothetical protein
MNKKEIIYQMACDFGHGDYSTIDEIDYKFWEDIQPESIANYLAEKLANSIDRYVTKDGASVSDGDKVYVIGSSGVTATKVDGKHTTYMYFNSMVPVSESWFSMEKAQEYCAR